MISAQQLLADAAAATEVRVHQTNPDVVALKVERARTVGDRLIWAGIGVFLVFMIITVQDFVAGDAASWSLPWVGAWFLEPGIVLGLIGILIWEGVVVAQRIELGVWTRWAKRGLLLATCVMNVAPSVVDKSFAGIVGHLIPPLAVFALVECRVEMLDRLTRAVARAYETAAADQRDHVEGVPLPEPAQGVPIPDSAGDGVPELRLEPQDEEIVPPAEVIEPDPEPSIETVRPVVETVREEVVSSNGDDGLELLTLVQLRDRAKQSGLASSGNRSAIIQRLRTHALIGAGKVDE